ncbi:MAG: BCCT family transporter, partial [Lachnospiraceae bacterium]|nr:BCCT family transporter [Lachnospiraceae bacterium]
MANKKILHRKQGKIDWLITLLPFCIVVALSILFFFMPEQSNIVLSKIRFFLGDTFGTYYLVIGLGTFLLSIYIAGSKYGDIVLGSQNEKPKYSFFAWGSMMFTAGLAADILFYSFSEWILYATDPHIAELGSIQDWSSVYPIFHWSLIPWGFYLVLAVAFGFMLHVRKRDRQKYSEACRPILGKYTDGILGRLIDLLAVFALLAGTATTFSLATPLMASIVNEIFHVQLSRTIITIVILVVTCGVYTYSLLHGFKGISILAKSCIYLFFGLLAFVLLFGGEARYIIETGFSALGRMVQNFFELATFTDPRRTTSFPQNWTIFYWAYWMVWCVAAPFFIGNISKGRTVRQTILGGYIFGVGSTIISFIILGNYSLGKQVSGGANFIELYQKTGDLYAVIISIIRTLPCAPFVLFLILITMVAFYATSFDSIALIAS